jgi:hypothetical protein
MKKPKLLKVIIKSIKPLKWYQKILIIALGLISVAGFIGIFIHEPILLIPTAVFAIAYETSN